MIWEIGSSYFADRPAGSRNPLLAAVKKAALGSTTPPPPTTSPSPSPGPSPQPPPGTALAFAVSSTEAAPASIARGQSVVVKTTVPANSGASNILIQFSLYNSSRQQVAYKIIEGQNFLAGQPAEFVWNHTVPSTLPIGNYDVQIGVFNADWSKNYTWVSDAARISVSDTPVSTNLLLNPSFEATGAWSMHSSAAVVTSNASSGVKALRIGASNGRGQQILTTLKPGASYALSVRAKVSQSTEKATVVIQFLNASGTVISRSSRSTAATTYTTLGMRVTVPAGTVRTKVFGYKAAGSQYAYFDQFNLVP